MQEEAKTGGGGGGKGEITRQRVKNKKRGRGRWAVIEERDEEVKHAERKPCREVTAGTQGDRGVNC